VISRPSARNSVGLIFAFFGNFADFCASFRAWLSGDWGPPAVRVSATPRTKEYNGMKKLILAALAGTAMLGLSACGDNDADTATSTDTTTTETIATPAPADTTTVVEETSGATDATATDATTGADGSMTTTSTTTAQ